ncbi:MAG: iron-siderophore ABC transporter substrate-binding protein [bacterium]
MGLRIGPARRGPSRGWGLPTLVVGLLLAACVGGGDDEDRGRSSNDPAEEVPDRAECPAREFEHRYGVTEFRGRPRRVVPVSIRDQEVLLSLGVVPAAVQDGGYRDPYPSWPWVPDALEEADPDRLPSGQLNFEQIARLRPDVILGAAAALTRREYRLLSRIAPTVAQSGVHVDHGVPWQDLTRTVGRLLCRTERADSLVAALEERMGEVRSRHPELVGASVVVGMPGGPEGTHWIYGPQDSRARLLAELGMDYPPEMAELAGNRFVATVSAERMDILESDVLIWLATPEQARRLEANPLYGRLPAVEEGRVLYLEPYGVLSAALTNANALNLPYILDRFVPLLVGAWAGEVSESDSTWGGAAWPPEPNERRQR